MRPNRQLAACVALLLAACGRLGFLELPTHDAGAAAQRDATVAVDSGNARLDAGLRPDAAAGATDSGPSCNVTAVSDYCKEIPLLKSDPRIDGELDCGPPLLDITPRGWTSASAIPAEQVARLAVAWRPNGLYVFLEVPDPTRLPWPPVVGTTTEGPWCGDGVEIYVDSDGMNPDEPLYDDPGTVQLIASAPTDMNTPVLSGGQRYRSRTNRALINAWTSTRYGAYPRASGGYTFEAFIKADDLDLLNFSPAAGNTIGFDIGVNVSVSAVPPPPGQRADCNRRLGQYFLKVASEPCTTESCRPYLNSGAFCKPTLR
jgi:predicted small lipoprotein YifL